MIQNIEWREAMMRIVESDLREPIDLTRLAYDELESLHMAIARARILAWRRRNRKIK